MPAHASRPRYRSAFRSLLAFALPGLAFAAAAQARTLYASPEGKAGASGTSSAPLSLDAGLAGLVAGDTLLLLNGTYAYKVQLTLPKDQSGTADKPICVFAAPGANPAIDFSGQPYAADGNPRGIEIDGSYWYLRGLEVKGSADNGIYVAGNRNRVENCVTHGNRDTGLQIGRRAGAPQEEWPADNLILFCESYDNYDLPPGGGENADGFACKLTSGKGNVFRGCVSHNNIDDGWDLYTKTDTGPIGPVTLDQCVAYRNGALTDGTSNGNGDRNGFKLGGSDIAVAHLVTRCVAFGNGKNGFTWNSNPGATRLANNLAFDNAEGNYNFGTSGTPTQAVFANNLSFWTKAGAASDKTLGTDYQGSNCWWDKSKGSVGAKSLVVAASDFAASLAALKVARNPATGAPDLSVFRLAAGSKLRDAGALPPGEMPFDTAAYYAGAPDLGAVEGEGVTGLAGRERASRSSPAFGANRLEARSGLLIHVKEGSRDLRGRFLLRPGGDP
jgi:hypothetical protein